MAGLPTTRPARLRAMVGLRTWPGFLGVWTLLVGLALWRLSLPLDPAIDDHVLMPGDSDSDVLLPERIERWLLLAHLGLQPVYPWVFLAPYLFWVTSRFPLERGRLRSGLPIQLTAAVAAVAASFAFRHFIAFQQPLTLVWSIVESHEDAVTRSSTNRGPVRSFSREVRVVTHQPPTNITSRLGLEMRHPGKPGPLPDILGRAPSSSLLLDLLACTALVGAAHSVFFQRRFRERERRAISLEAHLARTRLHALQAQLQPHFLFNALNSVTSLLRQDPRAAEEMLVSLSDLLRLALSQSAQQESPLREEMRFLELYRDIQQFRFGDRLEFEADLDPDSLDCLVPTLLLQPLVENAIRHGLEPSPRPVRVRVTSRRQADHLDLLVEDDGIGCSRRVDGRPTEGVGLSNVRARLEAHFGSTASLTFPLPAGGGFAALLRIPCPT